MDEKELNEILPVPSLNDMSNQVESELEAEEFKIKNFRVGKIFKTLEMIFLKAVNELYKLLLKVAAMVFVTDAEGFWLDMKAKEFGKERKLTTYAEGLVTVSRNESDGKSKQVVKGTIFKTDMSKDGKELRFIATETVVMEMNELRIYVPVKAEFPGTVYNLSQNMIKYSVQHISGIDNITNENNWLTKEGTDTESDGSLRKRCENVWDELAMYPTGFTYKSYVNEINGVLAVFVDDDHPRGQGTIDIIVTGVAGPPTETLLQAVNDKVAEIKGPYDNVLVYAPEVVYQDVDVTICINKLYGDEEQVQLEALEGINNLFKISENNLGNKLYRAKINHALMGIKDVTNVTVSSPAEDISLEIKKLITPGNITIDVVKEGD